MAFGRPAKRLGRVLILALAAALIGGLLSVSPWGRFVEERFGLYWLFQLRGPAVAPPEVVLVSIDKASSDEFGVPYDTSRWPRTLHTRLIEGLSNAGAACITFDLHFRVPRDDEDPGLAKAMRDAGNVALLEFLEKDQPGSVGQGARQMPVIMQRRLPPTEQIAAVAAGLGPFTLPKIPDQVSRFWLFDDNAGSVASLPVISLLLYATPAYQALQAARGGQAEAHGRGSTLVDLLTETAPDHVVDVLRELLAGHARRADAQGSHALYSDILTAVQSALTTSGSRYLNFYGPAQTVTTVSYADALRLLESPQDAVRFANKAVFVGVSSPVQWQMRDEFRTVYSDPQTGMDLSGSEILASAFANLLHGSSVEPLGFGAMLAILVAWSLIVAIVVGLLRPGAALLLLAIMSAAYLWLAAALFTDQYLWPPLVVPLAVIGPLLLFAAAFWQNRDARGDLVRIQEAFGRYLPQSTVKRLVAEGYSPLEDRRSVFGVCLITDAQGYTSVAEKIPSDQLVDLINDYLEVVISEIRRRGGEVSDIKGDSVMAFWASREDDRDIRASACRALVDIHAAVEHWNLDNRHGVQLPTRIGVHCGAMTLARVGAADHYEQRAVGDIVNTASRLEQLSKQLGTRLLVSADTIDGIDDLVTRDLGEFTLKGRVAPVRVHEVMGWKG
jgi:adenylate cyclase